VGVTLPRRGSCLRVGSELRESRLAKFSRNEKGRYKTLGKLRTSCGTPLALPSGMEGGDPRRMIVRLAVAMTAADRRITPSELSTPEKLAQATAAFEFALAAAEAESREGRPG
jgi:hypothetical protein